MENQDLEKESFIQKWAPHLVAGVLVAAIAFYASQFHGGLSNEQDAWGQFGDFVGGAVNPIIGFFTIWLLAVSLRQNHKALSQANTALTQAKAELELTRQSIEHAAGIQIATEAALKQQIEIAAHARDMNNAVSIQDHLGRSIERLTHIERGVGSPRDNQIHQEIEMIQGKMRRLDRILEDERLRIVGVYGES